MFIAQISTDLKHRLAQIICAHLADFHLRSSVAKTSFLILLMTLFVISNVFAALPWDKIADQILPRYPNSQLINQEDMTMNGKRAVTVNYDTQASPQDALNFYKENLKPKGWEVEVENTEEGLVVFKDIKGRVLSVSAVALEGQTRININYLPDSVLPTKESKPENLPEGQDVAGKDLAWLNRYPGSVRTMAFEDKGTVVLTYSAKTGNFDNIVEFYRSQLLAKNWELVNQVNVDQEAIEKSQADFKTKYEAQEQEEINIEEDLPKIEYAMMLVFENKSHLCLLNVIKMPDAINTVVQYVKK